jgi:hypothetical protein
MALRWPRGPKGPKSKEPEGNAKVAGRYCSVIVAATSRQSGNNLGGPENVSTAEAQLVQRAAVLAARIEDCEARWLEGTDIDVNEHLAAVNCQRRLLETLQKSNS